MKSARSVSSRVSDADAFSVVMKTETNTTRPRPIISAAAVDAVRRGFRFAFSCPRRPVIPRTRAGAPIAVASGLATNGDRTATPMKVNIAPRPTIAAGCGTSPNSPAAIAATPSAVSNPTDDRTTTERRGRSDGSLAQGLDRRDARRATRREHRRHDGHDRTDHERCDDRGRPDRERGRRQLQPDRLEALLEQDREPDPRGEPDGRAQEPDHQGLDDHGPEHLPAAGTQRSQEPQLAGPLRHHDVERVEDHEGPDEQRDEREHEQRRAEEAQALANLLRLLGGGVRRGDRLEAGREHLLDLRGDLTPPIPPPPPRCRSDRSSLRDRRGAARSRARTTRPWRRRSSWRTAAR